MIIKSGDLCYNLLFIILATFFIDSLLGAFFNIPLLSAVVFYIYISILLISAVYLNRLKSVHFILLILSFCIFINPFFKFFLFSNVVLSDFSDAAYFALFIVTPVFLTMLSQSNSVRGEKFISYFFVVCVFMIIPSFFSVEFYNQSQVSNVSAQSLDVEFLRAYKQGFFKHPHIASYFFTFLFICFFYKFLIERRVVLFLASFFCFFVILYTGSRSGLYGVLTGFVFSFIFTKGYRLLAIIGIVFIVLFLTNIELVASYFEGTFLFQYISFFITLKDNFERLSRVMIWSSWLVSILDFNAFEVILGRPFSQSASDNLARLGISIWFHNDWLNAFYSYGFLGVLSIFFSFLSLYKWVVTVSNSIVYSKVVFICMMFLSIVNGLYYYLPIVLFSLFYYSNINFHELKGARNE